MHGDNSNELCTVNRCKHYGDIEGASEQCNEEGPYIHDVGNEGEGVKKEENVKNRHPTVLNIQSGTT